MGEFLFERTPSIFTLRQLSLRLLLQRRGMAAFQKTMNKYIKKGIESLEPPEDKK
jgi:hypothetical protein